MKYLTNLFCIITLFVISLSLVISATDNSTYVYDYPEQKVTVEFSDNTNFSDDIRQVIADSIVYDLPMSQTYSLCWLLGHDTIVETVSAIYHEQSEYDPRCQWEIYDITSCTKCDYVYPALVSSKYISCCPPEASAVSLD